MADAQHNSSFQTQERATLRIGSRGSQLALWQANHIADRLRGAGHTVTIEIIKTLGDAMQHVPFAQVGGPQGDGKGMFTKEIEEALFAGRIDLAVHSLKDLPTELAAPFTIAAIPERVDPRDAFVSVLYASFEALPQGAQIGTSSLRRQAQLKAQRPDVVCLEFRGNVDTRLRKLAEGQVDAIILASAGLERLGLTQHRRECFSPLVLCPAAGQGALAIEARAANERTLAALAFLNHEQTRFAVTAERAALAGLGGGCQVPIGIHCFPGDEGYSIVSAVASPDGSEVLRVVLDRQTDRDPAALGRRVAKELIRQGAERLLGAVAQNAAAARPAAP
ncbi:MAG TPA: hydroxymethylbilane synthase [Acidobacteriaceae bacterium]|jgi:hydroxymethylbilane synthase|nr:hydroxymethylbilane synthase [Acidobacteriaceae bacterium]